MFWPIVGSLFSIAIIIYCSYSAYQDRDIIGVGYTFIAFIGISILGGIICSLIILFFSVYAPNVIDKFIIQSDSKFFLGFVIAGSTFGGAAAVMKIIYYINKDKYLKG